LMTTPALAVDSVVKAAGKVLSPEAIKPPRTTESSASRSATGSRRQGTPSRHRPGGAPRGGAGGARGHPPVFTYGAGGRQDYGFDAIRPLPFDVSPDPLRSVPPVTSSPPFAPMPHLRLPWLP
jgi:hypothetical protein